MAKLLEVIVTSAQEAREAEAGGADRLELVRALEVGGLTPELDVVRRVLDAASIPVRVMLRETATMTLGSAQERERLAVAAAQFAEEAVDGFVAGFLSGGVLDEEGIRWVCEAAPEMRVTFHRAFDELADPLAAIERLKRFRQIDRILTVGGSGSWEERRPRLQRWQAAAHPEMAVLAGAGVCPCVLAEIAVMPEVKEVHVGRAARVPQSVSGMVTREAVRGVKSILT